MPLNMQKWIALELLMDAAGAYVVVSVLGRVQSSTAGAGMKPVMLAYQFGGAGDPEGEK